jgi:hypothetical protein
MPISEIAKQIYDIIMEHKPELLINLVDFGGVAEHFLGGRGDNNYIEKPPTIKRSTPSFIFSFLPSNQKFEESTIMHETGLKTGFAGTIITTKKFGNKGKADFANELSKWIHFYYYEDTSLEHIWVQPDDTSEFHNTYPNDKNIQIMSIPDFLISMLET